MKNIVLVLLIVCASCNRVAEDSYSNLYEYVSLQTENKEDNVIACAASDKDTADKVYVFFYPIPGATEIRYFETADLNGVKENYTLYEEVVLDSEPVFNGYLRRFVRSGVDEVRCIVTYKVDGKLRISQPIRLKHQTKPTEWTDEVTIDFTDETMPKFSWADGMIDENAIYFQVITDAYNSLLSGTYTYDKWFQYYSLDNVVLNVTLDTPPELIVDENYYFTLMAVSLDNWVNLVIEKEFLISKED